MISGVEHPQLVTCLTAVAKINHEYLLPLGEQQHIANLRDVCMDPRFGLVGPGRLLERPPRTSTDDSLVRLRPGDWWLGSLVSYKGELIEEFDRLLPTFKKYSMVGGQVTFAEGGAADAD